MFRPWKTAALAASAFCLLSLAASPAIAAPAARVAAKVPLGKVGPGWSVVEYSSGSLTKSGTEILYLTSPEGKKYRIYSRKAAPVPQALIDWSGNGQRVLLNSQFDANSPDNIEQVSVATGKVISRFSWPGSVYPLGYTKPDGLNILAVSYTGTRWQLQRYNLQGQLQKVLASGGPQFDPAAIYSPGGTSLIVSMSKGLEEVSNLGGVTARFVVGRTAACYPKQWQNSSTVLAVCYPRTQTAPPRNSLWLVNIKTGKSSLLGNPPKGTQAANAWRLGSRLYQQDYYYCDFISQQYRNGSTHVIKVPGNAGAQVAGVLGSRLLLAAQPKCGPIGTSLAWFNPVTKALHYVLRPKGATTGVEHVVAFGERGI
ncbi:MAG TPA: hypothetical protein VMA95_06540 [Streptosporangiaceae bacterium]|nr:hypothetical protein [Streptosporangiaceae bacterium]